MKDYRPDLDDLLGEDVASAERERLRGAHELLLAVGPPPELPPSLQSPPELDDKRESAAFALLPRRGGRILTLAAGFAAMTLVIGYVIGHNRASFNSVQSVRMHGTAAAPRASGVVEVAKRDANGNYPLELSVSGLRPLPRGSYYVLYLIKDKRPAAICGAFLVHEGATTVRMSAPYDYHEFDGWTIAVYRIGKAEHGTTLLASGKTV